ncbi:hypothetical protein DWB85_18295 [Seongchinamella sediminis]|uniref:Dihydrodipicolinate reductase N-terminal domain-containing protein n=1 Tax=Seongchinamella sediminis TaxID=2283635 RepID=A0A3L7DS29_9GAMM|nr:hypothetical protein [Seongchinamella sediminis]RLQ20298.1 hypothetical protein DWB85_18295 [Seongchinamella sediminis]
MSYRVIQWATGAMGKTCLRAVIDHPDLELAGLYVYNPAKVGRDAGDIARRPATGVIATNEIEAILQLEADVVLHTAQLDAPYCRHNADICRLLASGKNVISINGHSYPQFWGQEYLRAFEEACREGGSSLLGGGLNPGFITDKIATIATSICLDIEHIEVTETIDCRIMQNPDYVFDMLGFGKPGDGLDPNDPTWGPAELMNGMYSEVVAHLARRLGYALQRVETDHVMYPASAAIDTSAGRIDKGGVSHTNWRWHAIVDGSRRITQSIHWIMEKAHLNDPDYTTWEVRVRGLPCIDFKIDLGLTDDHAYRTMPEQYGVAGSLVNAIPGLVEAPPGIREVPLGDLFRAPSSAAS